MTTNSELPLDVWRKVINVASPWSQYCLALTCKGLLAHYQDNICDPFNNDDVLSDHFPREFPDVSDNDENNGWNTPYVYKPFVPSITLLDPAARAAFKARHACNDSYEEFGIEPPPPCLAGISQPLGNLSTGRFDFVAVKGYNFEFRCSNFDGESWATQRRLLLIDDYWRLRCPRGKVYDSFVVGKFRFQPNSYAHKAFLPDLYVFKATFLKSHYVPLMGSDEDECAPKARTKREHDDSIHGFFKSDSGMDPHMTKFSYKGFSGVDFTISTITRRSVFCVILTLTDIDYRES